MRAPSWNACSNSSPRSTGSPPSPPSASITDWKTISASGAVPLIFGPSPAIDPATWVP